MEEPKMKQGQIDSPTIIDEHSKATTNRLKTAREMAFRNLKELDQLGMTPGEAVEIIERTAAYAHLYARSVLAKNEPHIIDNATLAEQIREIAVSAFGSINGVDSNKIHVTAAGVAEEERLITVEFPFI